MTKAEAEARIWEKLMEIQAILKEYNPDDTYFSVGFTDNYIFAHNHYWRHRGHGVINIRKERK